MAAGDLRERVAFAVRGTGDDGAGNVTTTFADQFTVAARIRPLKGGEAVLAQRLTGVQPVLITVRYSAQAKIIKSDWQARDVRSGTIYNIKSIANTDEHKKFLDIVATAGEAA